MPIVPIAALDVPLQCPDRISRLLVDVARVEVEVIVPNLPEVRQRRARPGMKHAAVLAGVHRHHVGERPQTRYPRHAASLDPELIPAALFPNGNPDAPVRRRHREGSQRPPVPRGDRRRLLRELRPLHIKAGHGRNLDRGQYPRRLQVPELTCYQLRRHGRHPRHRQRRQGDPRRVAPHLGMPKVIRGLVDLRLDLRFPGPRAANPVHHHVQVQAHDFALQPDDIARFIEEPGPRHCPAHGRPARLKHGVCGPGRRVKLVIDPLNRDGVRETDAVVFGQEPGRQGRAGWRPLQRVRRVVQGHVGEAHHHTVELRFGVRVFNFRWRQHDVVIHHRRRRRRRQRVRQAELVLSIEAPEQPDAGHGLQDRQRRVRPLARVVQGPVELVTPHRRRNGAVPAGNPRIRRTGEPGRPVVRPPRRIARAVKRVQLARIGRAPDRRRRTLHDPGPDPLDAPEAREVDIIRGEARTPHGITEEVQEHPNRVCAVHRRPGQKVPLRDRARFPPLDKGRNARDPAEHRVIQVILVNPCERRQVRERVRRRPFRRELRRVG